ncbi:hypothetical protein [Prescottella agglutinans]|uniref:Uncharacterized protein n=1 Tax=Prescottella agglutinans TaxID=1644129 RepID=A0ABT6MKP8_9NOCA|nr:hypothetical protein [Prescottella agglutinans]MDH6284450.1 hypothetical protein [Prescottella agglutinans]
MVLDGLEDAVGIAQRALDWVVEEASNVGILVDDSGQLLPYPDTTPTVLDFLGVQAGIDDAVHAASQASDKAAHALEAITGSVTAVTPVMAPGTKS